jgi:hypothetical protein
MTYDSGLMAAGGHGGARRQGDSLPERPSPEPTAVSQHEP